MIDNKLHYNKFYIFSALLLCVFTHLLNVCTTIYQCALIFTIIAITTNGITLRYSPSQSLKTLAFAMILNFALLSKLPYYIDGKIVNGLVLTSFLSLLISMYFSTAVLQKLTDKLCFMKANALSIILASVIDGFIMGVFFILNNQFSYSRVIDIFIREVSYKIIYILIASFIMNFYFKIHKNRYGLKNALTVSL